MVSLQLITCAGTLSPVLVIQYIILYSQNAVIC